MNQFEKRLPALIFIIFIVVSLFVGWSIPDFYAWTDSDQSRPSPLLWKVPFGSAVASFAFCLTLPWLPIGSAQSSNVKRRPIRFGLRTLLMFTTIIAIVIGVLVKFPLVTSGSICAASFAYFIWFVIRHARHRMAALTLLACMIFPYAWVVGYDEFDWNIQMLAWIIAALSTFAPAALIGKLAGLHFQEIFWIAFLLTALELTVGIWIIRTGLKRTIAYSLLAMLMSAFGSLTFYQACIA